MTPSFLHVNRLTEVTERTPTYLAIGSFDGVHIGHQQVLGNLVAAARQDGVRAAVLTFFPHPKRVIQGLRGPYYLSTLAQRVAQLAGLGFDLIITHPFDDEVRQTRAADFVAQLCRHLDMRQLWGGNFALGYKREGDVPFLRRLGAEKGYTVEVVEAMATFKGELVSSSRIRRCLVNGEIETVNGCLGRPYQLCGEVVLGDQRGRTIHFPTANLHHWEEQLLPANGVYATIVTHAAKTYRAATNVGVRPTVDGQRLLVEAHLLDFDGDLYGEQICVNFVSRIRPEMKFSGLDQLQAQIQSDVAWVRRELPPGTADHD